MSSVNALNPFATTPNPSPYGASSSTGTSGASGSSGSSSSATGSNELNGNDFIALLTAQLQAQDPLNPIDPTTFVTQLVEFNQLQQLIDINSTLGGVATSSATTAAGANAATANANAFTQAAGSLASIAPSQNQQNQTSPF